MMLNSFSRVPIFRRLFLAFLLAGVVPNGVLVVISLIYTHLLVEKGVLAQETTPYMVGTILAVVVSLALVAFFGWATSRTIASPLNQLASLALRIQQGETSARATIAGNDEIAIVAASINQMLDQIVQFIQRAEDERDGLRRQIDQLMKEVSGIGEGDLTIQASTQGSLGILAASFNYMLEALSSLVIGVQRMAVDVEESTGVTQQEVAQLVAIAQAQFQQIHTVARTIESMVQTCFRVAERTQVLDQTAKESRQSALQGRQTVQQTLGGIELIRQNAQRTAAQMRTLEEHAKEIHDIIRELDSIARTTTRLALDASIQSQSPQLSQPSQIVQAFPQTEQSRQLSGQSAGTGQTAPVENTAGFGQVTGSIRHLAEQTKQRLVAVANKMQAIQMEITTASTSIHESEQENALATKRIQSTGESLAAMVCIVDHQADEIDAMNQMIRQLLTSSHVVSEIMQAIATTTAQTSERVQTVAQKASVTRDRVDQLRSSVGVFKVRSASVPLQKESARL